MFENEVLHSHVQYIVIGNPYYFLIQNISFSSISDDHSSTEETDLLVVESIDLSEEGLVNLTQMTITNCSVTFLNFGSVSGHTDTKKMILFDYITVQDSVFTSRNDLILLGPLYSEEDVELHMNHVTFTNLNFKKLANIIHMKQQTSNPFYLENTVFHNCIGGHVLVEPLTVSSTSVYSQIFMKNVTVSENDFGASTFVVLKEH